MKILFLFCLTLITNQFLHAQLPKGPDGKELYQKGDCKTILPNVKYKCVFCEDKALTKNCKEYDCSLTECTESKGIKSGDGRLLAKPVNIEGIQVRGLDNKDSTNKQLSTPVDVTGYINSKKIANGKILVYENDDQYKIFAVYKKGQLTEWYAMGEDGKKIMSSPVALTPTTCEDCIITPGGVTFCKKCTVTPGVILPAKSLN